MKTHEGEEQGTTALKSILSAKKRVPDNNSQNIWYLEKVIRDNNKKYSITINKFPFHIGRDSDCELPLPSRYISKYHAEIIKDGNDLKIFDLGSVNGTYINRQPVKGHSHIHDGDILHFNKLFDDDLAFKVICKGPTKAISEGKSQIVKNYGNQISNYFKGRRCKIENNDFNFSIGLSFFIEFKNGNICHLKAPLYSWKQGTSLTLDIPKNYVSQIKAEDRCMVKFSSDGKVFGFETTVLTIENEITPHLSLKYPDVITCMAYRRHTRYKTNLKAVIRQSLKDRLIDCKIVDISLGGCRVSFNADKKPAIEGEAFLTMVNLINDIRVIKIHESKTKSGFEIGFKITSYGGAEKKRKFEEILNLHAPVKQ